MGEKKTCELVAVAVVVIAVMMAGVGDAQPACANKLVPCAPYLNSTSPPANCCTALKEAVENERDCLCNLYKNPTFLQSLGINITQALQLPKHCGVSDDLSACNTAGTPSPTGSPPATPGKDDNGVGTVAAWTGMTRLLLLGISLILLNI